MVSLLMQNTQKLSQLLNEIGFEVFNLEGFKLVGAKLAQFIEDEAKELNEGTSGYKKMSQFIVIADKYAGHKIALLFLVDVGDDAVLFSKVEWECNFTREDWSAMRGRCAEFATSVDGAMEVSEAIENMFAWTDRDKI